MMPKTRYRIVTDNYCGYEVQRWCWWWPFWTDTFGGKITNTHSSVEKAEAWLRSRTTERVVKYIDADQSPA